MEWLLFQSHIIHTRAKYFLSIYKHDSQPKIRNKYFIKKLAFRRTVTNWNSNEQCLCHRVIHKYAIINIKSANPAATETKQQA